MKKIKLNLNKYALVDDEDYDFINQWNWCTCKDGNKYYATTHIYKNRKRTNISMHRMILKSPKSFIDHINGNGLDNQKKNIRLATNSQNQANRGKPSTNTSGYKGVHKARNKWRAVIKQNGKKFELGTFINPEEASMAYNSMAIKLFGNFAKV